MTKKISCKALFFDLDHTLYDYDRCHGLALKTTLDYLAKKLGWSLNSLTKAYQLARKQTHVNLKGQAASHSRLLYFKKTIEKLSGKTLAQLSLEAERLYWQTFLARMRLRPSSLHLLKKAKKQGVKLVIVTNLTTQIQLQKINKLKIGHYIDFVVTSEEAGVEKPDPRIFKLALEKVKVNISEVCYVGDEEDTDIKGAIKLGLTTIYIHLEPPKDKTIVWVRDFTELGNLLFKN